MEFYTSIQPISTTNLVIFATLSKTEWDALTTLPCKSGSKILVKDFGGVGLHKEFVKKDNTDHAKSGFVETVPAIEKAYTVSGTNTLKFSTGGQGGSSYITGEKWTIKIANENTGAITINRDGLGAKSLRIESTSTLLGGEIKANTYRTITYDGTNFIFETASLPSTFDNLYFNYSLSRATDATTTSGLPPNNTLRWNDSDHTLASEIYIHILGSGTNKTDFLSKLLPDTILFIEDTITGATEAWVVVSAVSSGSNWITVTVDNSALTNVVTAGNPIRMYLSHTYITGKNTRMECIDFYAIITGQIFHFGSTMRVLSPFVPASTYVEIGSDVGTGETGFLAYNDGVGDGAFFCASGIRKKSDGTFLVEFTY